MLVEMPLSTDELRARLANQRWTAQNIVLNEEVSTIPERPEFLAQSPHVKAVLRTVTSFFGKDLRGVRMADLGCLEGGYSLAFARLGADVVGIEARKENIEKCRLLEAHFAMPNLRFEQADVKELTRDRFGEFDVVLALGILYHLDSPVSWLRQVGQVTRALLLVEGHFAPETDAALAQLKPELQKLGPLDTVVEQSVEYPGRWFAEYETNAERDAMPWASYSNPRSFWLTRPSLLRAIAAAGFDLVYEQYDHWINRYETVSSQAPRSLFIGGKSQALKRRPR
jgi:SAM-dependent methyltransferase